MSRFDFYLLLLLAGGLTTFSACEEDTDPNEAANNRLNGEWNVESFVAQGATTSELMGNVYTRIQLEFEKSGADDGEYEFTFVSTGGSTAVGTGDYEISDDGTELELEPDDGSPDEEYDLEFDGDEVELDGLFQLPNQSVRAIIRAERD
jgi:hypothetical protein